MISLKIFCLLILNCGNVYTEEISGLLSRLYKSAMQTNKPLVLIIDRSSQQENEKYPLKPSDLLETSGENENEDEPVVYLIKSQPQKRKPLGHLFGKETYYRGPQYGYKRPLQKHKGTKGQLRIFGSTPSPILKTLLRVKNEMNCEANSECRIECKIRFGGKKRDACANKCEIKYECDPEEAADPCENESDDCNEDDKNPSTRGIKLVTEKPDCPKC